MLFEACDLLQPWPFFIFLLYASCLSLTVTLNWFLCLLIITCFTPWRPFLSYSPRSKFCYWGSMSLYWWGWDPRQTCSQSHSHGIAALFTWRHRAAQSRYHHVICKLYKNHNKSSEVGNTKDFLLLVKCAAWIHRIFPVFELSRRKCRDWSDDDDDERKMILPCRRIPNNSNVFILLSVRNQNNLKRSFYIPVWTVTEWTISSHDWVSRTEPEEPASFLIIKPQPIQNQFIQFVLCWPIRVCRNTKQ